MMVMIIILTACLERALLRPVILILILILILIICIPIPIPMSPVPSPLPLLDHCLLTGRSTFKVTENS